MTDLTPTVSVRSFKMPFATPKFNLNQRVWVVVLSGTCAALCCGRFRGKGRYIRAWVNWDSDEKRKLMPAAFDVFEVDAGFAERHGITPSGDPRP